MQEKILGELQRVMSKDPNGLLRPEAIVQAATSPDSPLHKHFTWDNSAAAEAYRIWEARALIKRVQLYVEPLDIKVKMFTSLGSDRATGFGYRLMTDVMASTDLRAEMLATALKELGTMQSRYQHLEEFSKLWDTVEEIEATLDRRVKRRMVIPTIQVAGAR